MDNQLHEIVNRSWQKGAGYDAAFNEESCENRLAIPIEHMLETSGPELAGITVVVNGDNRFPAFMGEAVAEDGTTPTVRALHKRFGNRVTTIVDREWGNNAGSAHALNIGWQRAAQNPNVSHIFSWNTEMALSGSDLRRMRQFMAEHDLEVCGQLRQGYDDPAYPTRRLFQNTATMYRLSLLQEVDGFDPWCDGNDGATIQIEGLGKVVIAGMDDQDAFARAVAMRMLAAGRELPCADDVPKWGMVGVDNPAAWQTVFPNDPARQKMFDDKIARQLAVFKIRVARRLPHLSFEAYLELLWQHMHLGA